MHNTQYVFRFDAGRKIGLGHWYRCLALVEILRHRGVKNIKLLLNKLDPRLKNELLKRHVAFQESDDWGAFETILKEMKAAPRCVLILDTMQTDKSYVQNLLRHVPVITIGGSGEGRNYASVRIDGMIPRPGYSDDFVGEQLFIGPEYLILREEFSRASILATSDNAQRVLVALGGDASGHGFRVTAALHQVKPQLSISVMVGVLAAVPKDLHPKITVMQDLQNPSTVMRNCDIAITGGGMTTYEFLYLGVPVALITFAASQTVSAASFAEHGLAKYLGLVDDEEPLTTRLDRTLRELADPVLRRRLGERGRKLIDGQGGNRVAQIILDMGERERN
jgi:spore coat polysaccharide biosynthesis predicted glycosyltransferase SpsG